jgi:hypothetical protein
MRNSKLLIGTTALALLAGTGIGFTQGGMPQGPAMHPPSGGERGAPGNAQREQPGAQPQQPGRAQSERGPKTPDQTTGQAPRPQGERNEGPAQGQPKQIQPKQGAGQKNRDDTTGQAPRSQNPAPAQNGQTGERPQAQPQPGQNNAKPEGVETRGQAGAHVNFTAEQRTRIRETIIRSNNAPRATNVNFNITVGAVVPRTVRLAPLPALIVDVEPAWRGYMYFVVGDEIIVVEPNTLKIVAVIAV